MKEQISENMPVKYTQSMCTKPFQLKVVDDVILFQFFNT